LMERLHQLDAAVERIEGVVLAYGVLLMAAVSIANVFARNLFDHSLTFAEEVSRILTVLITFMGIGYGVRHARHIRMSALYDQLRGCASSSCRCRWSRSLSTGRGR